MVPEQGIEPLSSAPFFQVSNQSPSPKPKGHISYHAIFCEQTALGVYGFGAACIGPPIFPKTKRLVMAALRRNRYPTQRWDMILFVFLQPFLILVFAAL